MEGIAGYKGHLVADVKGQVVSSHGDMSGVDTEEFASSLTRILFASSILLSQTHVSEKISQVTLDYGSYKYIVMNLEGNIVLVKTN